MSIVLDGTGTITGLTATGISAVQQLPAGSVLQVVQGTYNINQANSSSTYADTGLAASITPKFTTSKVLVIVNQAGCGKVTNNTGVNLILQRAGSTIYQIASGMGINAQTGTSNRFFTISGAYLDSPATTSSIQYKTQFASSAGNTQVNVQDYATDLVTSTITLMEIAQ
jgi:aspartate oxidase